jgi:hypothetical protein
LVAAIAPIMKIVAVKRRSRAFSMTAAGTGMAAAEKCVALEVIGGRFHARALGSRMGLVTQRRSFIQAQRAGHLLHA